MKASQCTEYDSVTLCDHFFFFLQETLVYQGIWSSPYRVICPYSPKGVGEDVAPKAALLQVRPRCLCLSPQKESCRHKKTFVIGCCKGVHDVCKP